MNNTKTLACLIAMAALFSCKKDKQTSSNAIDGDWNFTALSANTISSVSYTDGDDFMDVTKSQYSVTDITGSVNFSGNTSTSTNIGYSATLPIMAYEYDNGELTDSLSTSMSFTMQPYSASSTYDLIGSDSIVFHNGGPVNGSTGSATVTGAHYSVSGNTLLMTAFGTKDSTFTQSDITYTKRDTIYMQSTFTRK